MHRRQADVDDERPIGEEIRTKRSFFLVSNEHNNVVSRKAYVKQ